MPCISDMGWPELPATEFGLTATAMLNWFRKNKNGLIITNMQKDDLPWIADIHAKGFSKAWSDGDFREILSGKGSNGLVARRRGYSRDPEKGHSGDGSDITGFLVYRTAADEAEIITIATDPQSRRTGIGGALLEEMIRRCLADRLASIFLEVDSVNTAAITLYRKHGFKQAGIRKGYYSAKPDAGIHETTGHQLANQAPVAHDAIIMRLALNDQD